MSESLPYSGVVIVDVIRYAVVTQACRDSPCRSSPMVRIAVATMVWSRAARNMPIISPPRIVRIWRCVMEKVGAAGAPSAVSGAVTEVRYVRFPTMALSMTGQWSDVGHRDAAAPRRTVRRRRSRRANPPDLGHDRAEPGRPSSGRQGVVTMGIGSGIFLVVVGAVLAFALEPDTWDVVNLNIVGYVMIVGGILALVLGMYYNKQRTNTSHREVVERYEDRCLLYTSPS